ncbi:MAG TPA: hypothetical protein VGB97_01075 [Candidatus Paceibacterota bacterium]|jgi:hypothetical protein
MMRFPDARFFALELWEWIISPLLAAHFVFIDESGWRKRSRLVAIAVLVAIPLLAGLYAGPAFWSAAAIALGIELAVLYVLTLVAFIILGLMLKLIELDDIELDLAA